MNEIIFFKDYIFYKPHFNKIDEESFADKLINCKYKCFHSSEVDCVCDVQFKDFKNKKINKKEVRDDGLIKKRSKLLLTQ